MGDSRLYRDQDCRHLVGRCSRKDAVEGFESLSGLFANNTAPTPARIFDPPQAAAMDPDVVQRVQQSFGRCLLNTSQGKGFLDAFYDEFLMSDPRVKPHFSKTDMQKQKDLLRRSISMLILFGSGSGLAKSAVENLALRHDRNHLNIVPDLYRFWVKSLLACIATYDQSYDALVAEDWSEVLKSGVAAMTKAY